MKQKFIGFVANHVNGCLYAVTAVSAVGLVLIGYKLYLIDTM